MWTHSPLVTWGHGWTLPFLTSVAVQEKLHVRGQEESDSYTSLATK